LGQRADFALWDVARPAELACAFGANPCVGRVVRGSADAAGIPSLR
jgi:imidazolonepropionase